MNVKRFVIASVVIYVLSHVIGYLVHMVLLGGMYRELASIWRPDMMQYMWIMWLTSLLWSFLFVYIFIRGYENRGILEGVRYGVIIALFMAVPNALANFVIYPVPLKLALAWLACGSVESVLYGIIAAAVYRPKGE